MVKKEITKLIDNNKIDVLFFDIFDTIVTRNVHPEYVKKIFSKRLQEEFAIRKTDIDIYKVRNRLESELCKENEANGYDLEFKFDDMLVKLYKELHLKEKNITLEYFLEFCNKIELNVEEKVQNLDLEVIELAKYAQTKQVKTVCLSDFYHNTENIKKLFDFHEISSFFDEIYVSSDFLLTKRTGRLYKEIIDKYFKNDKIAMIGDNLISDYQNALKYNILAHKLDRKEQFEFYDKHQKSVHTPKNLQNQLDSIFVKKYEYIDFKELSFTIFYFIYKLYLELKMKNIKNIFFFSREGQFLKTIFDDFLELNNLSKDIKSHYLIVSRKSTFICSLKALEKENFETLFRQYRRMSILDFLKNLNFNNDIIQEISNIIDINKVQEDLPTSEAFVKLKNIQVFKNTYEKNRLEQKNNIIKYIEQFGVNIYDEGISIVDAGWKGTIQDHLFLIFDKKIQFNGYYIGLLIDLMKNEKNYKKGLIFNYDNKDKFYNIYSENTSLYEVFLGANHGSADKYIEVKGKIEVKKFLDEKEELIFEKYIKPFQKTSKMYIDEIIKIFDLAHHSPLEIEKYMVSKHSRMVHYPTKKEVQFFKKLYHYENFGNFGYSEFSNRDNLSLKQRVKNLINFLKNPKKTLNSGFWKAATLDDLGLFFLYKFYVKYREYKNKIGKK